LKDYEKALLHHREALEIRKSQGPVSRSVSGALYRIAGTLRNLERHAEAAEIAREMLEIDNQLLVENKITKAELGFRQSYAARVFTGSLVDQKEIRELLLKAIANLKTEAKRLSWAIREAEQLLEILEQKK